MKKLLSLMILGLSTACGQAPQEVSKAELPTEGAVNVACELIMLKTIYSEGRPQAVNYSNGETVYLYSTHYYAFTVASDDSCKVNQYTTHTNFQ